MSAGRSAPRARLKAHGEQPPGTRTAPRLSPGLFKLTDTRNSVFGILETALLVRSRYTHMIRKLETALAMVIEPARSHRQVDRITRPGGREPRIIAARRDNASP